MSQEDRFTAIVPARSGSKRLENKNMRLLRGRPLVFHTLDAVLGHDAIERVIFTTDSRDYIDRAAETYGDRLVYEHRPAETAQDTTKVVDEVARLKEARPELFPSPWFGLFLPTAPLRDFDVVADAVARWRALETPVFSCHAYDFAPQFAFYKTAEEDGWRPMLGDQSPMITGQTRSQDIPTAYRPNGAIYITRWDVFLRRKVLYDNAAPIEISEQAAIDVDTAFSLLLAENVLIAADQSSKEGEA